MSMTPKRAQLHSALRAIQMHAAGMHAAASLAMQLLAETDTRRDALERLRHQHAGPAHYGDDPAEDVETLFEQAGAGAPEPAQGADTPPQE